jgi:Tol biopolymer transport system component
VSVSSSGRQANGESNHAAISADGRFVAFDSDASNLVANDTNNQKNAFLRDVFVHDRITGETTRVSVSSEGAQANADSVSPAISAAGRFVAFTSQASNLVGGDTNKCRLPNATHACYDVFVRDRVAGTTERVSVSSSGRQANAGSWASAISADGRFVVFTSRASNLVVGDTNRCNDPDAGRGSCPDVFVRDRVAQTTKRVSLSSSGSQAHGFSSTGLMGAVAPVGVSTAAISADGRLVAFTSEATDLVARDVNKRSDVFVRDREIGRTTLVTVGRQ